MATRKTTTPRWKVLAYRAGAVAVCAGLVWFAVEGGEFGTRALFSQHSRRQQLQAEVAELRHQVDSLEKEKTALLKNDGVLERIAREQYGMLRGNKELLFWIKSVHSTQDSTALATDTMASARLRAVTGTKGFSSLVATRSRR